MTTWGESFLETKFFLSLLFFCFCAQFELKIPYFIDSNGLLTGLNFSPPNAKIIVVKTSVFGLILGLIGLVSAASLGAIILFISPPQGGLMIPIVFSVSLLLLLVSALSFLGLSARKKFITERNRQRIFLIAFREGLLFSVLGLVYLWLAHFGFLKIWLVVVLFLLIIGLEYLILTRQ